MKFFKFKRKSTPIIITLIILMTLTAYFGAAEYVLRPVRAITNPIIRSANYTGSAIADYISPYFNRSDLAEKNKILSQKLIDLAKENIELKLYKTENELLKNELEFTSDLAHTYYIAQVLGSGPDYVGTELIINKGTDHGITNGLPATTAQGVLIGKVDKIEDNLSHIKLLTDNTSKVSVIVAGSQSALGLIHGEHNINLKIDMLPKDAEISVGDLVTTAGIDKDTPAGLLIGTITDIENRQESLWQTATVEPATNYRSTSLITIIKPTLD